MLSAEFLMSPASEPLAVTSGTVLLERSQYSPWVIYVESGRVGLGVLEGNVLTHQLGVLQGPAWLEASTAVLNQPSVIDAVAQTDVLAWRWSTAHFRQSLQTMPTLMQALLRDVAQAHRQQTEMAISRLAKDAQARCAQWLLAHMEPGEQGIGAVRLQVPKSLIAAQLGIAPETLSRVLRYLRDRGLISGSGRMLNMLDLGGLRSLAGA